ncbi:cobalamin-dependent protein [uncultured Erythrobacter sp.]|uniref:cobalamin B12-binding domain-containing protein n=2 Tax=uncultured Erythrobacter sp. TaxID=263913 RepID=UPI0026048615|nr:cobalamin-dependent protein [uncultured Erythrobacter sp.]
MRDAANGSLRPAKPYNKAQEPMPISSAEARRFAQLPLNMEADGLLAEVDDFLIKGVPINTIYLDLLAPAARRLGKLWEEDQCDFVDVTMGLWRLQEVLYEISARAPAPPKPLFASSRRALFLPMPGDQHFMGPQVLGDIFTREGWDVLVMTKPQRKEVLNLLSRESFDVVGLTLSRDCPSAALRNIIRAMRSVSRNEHLSILVGGRMINQNPAIVAEVGADGTGADARAALKLAERLVQSAEVRAQTLR